MADHYYSMNISFGYEKSNPDFSLILSIFLKFPDFETHFPGFPWWLGNLICVGITLTYYLLIMVTYHAWSSHTRIPGSPTA